MRKVYLKKTKYTKHNLCDLWDFTDNHVLLCPYAPMIDDDYQSCGNYCAKFIMRDNYAGDGKTNCAYCGIDCMGEIVKSPGPVIDAIVETIQNKNEMMGNAIKQANKNIDEVNK